MSQDAVVSYLQTKSDENSPPRLSERLSDALKKYKIDSELQNLRSAYSQHLAREEELKNIRVNTPSIIKSLGTLNIAPTNSYNRYLAVLKNQSDYDAILSDWKMVGEDLSFAYIKSLLEGIESNE